MISEGLYTFSVSQWVSTNGIERKAADVDCRKLYDKGLVDRSMDEAVMIILLHLYRISSSGIRGRKMILS